MKIIDERRRFTLDDLETFIHRCKQNGVPGTALIRGQVGFKGFIKMISVSDEEVRDDRDGWVDIDH